MPRLAPPAGNPEVDLDPDRPAGVTDFAPHLLAHGPALLLRQRKERLPGRSTSPLKRLELGIEGRELKAVALRRDAHSREACALEQRKRPRLVAEGEGA